MLIHEIRVVGAEGRVFEKYVKLPCVINEQPPHCAFNFAEH